MVGVIDSPDEINSDATVAVFPKSLLREDVGAVATVMQVRLRHGYTASDLRRELDTLPNHAALSLGPGVVISSRHPQCGRRAGDRTVAARPRYLRWRHSWRWASS